MLLIIGYGNPLRTDDAVGLIVAHALIRRFDDGQTKVVTAHQLTPELSEPISRASMVVFIDARHAGHHGAIGFYEVVPEPGEGVFTHNATPGSLLAAARDLYGTAPFAMMITIAGASFEYGTELSPKLAASIPRITGQIHRLIEGTRKVHHA